MDGFLKFCCSHSLHTEVDQDGNALCLKCGAVLSIHLTREKMDAFGRLWQRWDGWTGGLSG